MSYSRYFKAVFILLALLVGYSAAAKASSGRVRSVIGDVTLQKNGNADWVPLRIDNKVKQGDFIRTLLESQAIISLGDGSTFSVEENSLVTMVEVNYENGVNQFTAEVKSGKVQFDIQKQDRQDSRVHFKTGIAVAAIRGTKGIYGLNRRGKPIGALGTGLMEITMGQQTVSVKGGQAVITINDILKVIDLKGAGDPALIDLLDSLTSDTTIVADSLDSKIKELDDNYFMNLQKAKEAIKCEFEAIADTIYEQSIVIKANCTHGLKLQIGAEKKTSESGEYEFNPNWAPSSIGEKKFPITCSILNFNFECGYLRTYYAGKKEEPEVLDTSSVITPLAITTPSPAIVCDPAAVTVEGTFNGKDPMATLYVTLGKQTSPNLQLLSANDKFSYTFNISDKNGNWDEKKVSVEYTSKIFGSATATLDLSVNKSCKNVNTYSPTIALNSSDSLKCEASLNIGNVIGDDVFLKTSVDGTPAKEQVFSSNAQVDQKLISGIHRYTFEVEDIAHNSHRVEKTLGCYPAFPVKISFANGSHEVLRIPPPPQGIENIYRNLRFTVSDIPQNNIQHIKRITITQNNKSIELRPTDILSNSIDRQIELKWGVRTPIKVEVVMKSGKIVTATKIYEFER